MSLFIGYKECPAHLEILLHLPSVLNYIIGKAIVPPPGIRFHPHSGALILPQEIFPTCHVFKKLKGFSTNLVLEINANAYAVP